MVKIFKALSDPNRLRILKMLQIRSLCVCEVRDILNLANSTVSKHLTVLRDAELILDEKDGKWVNYRLNRDSSDKYVAELLPLLAQWLPDDTVIRNDAQKVCVVNRDHICAT
ncbi:MAG: transcriptional regulator [Phototrophicales bacterium]|nr:MAG: transcriptional regulator [Phototrophicales bacterium]